MARWSEIEAEAPALAAMGLGFLTARTHLTLATLRRNGAPRISGIELQHVDGDLWLGMMGGSLKARDLRRDPRFALHSGSEDPPGWYGDAKVAGRAVEVLEPSLVERVIGAAREGDGPHLFRLELTELVVVRLGDPADHLLITSWHEGRGTTSLERR